MKIVNAELIEHREYVSMGKNPVDRMKTLLDRLDSVRRSKQGGYKLSDAARETSHKFVGSVQQIFKNLPKPLEWRSFYIHDLPLLLSTCKEVQDASIQHNLNKSQIKVLAKLKKASENEFKRFANPEPSSPKVESAPDNQRSGARDLSDFSAAVTYCNNTQLFQSVRKSLEDGLPVSEVAKKHAWPEPLVWSIALESKSDLDRFKALI